MSKGNIFYNLIDKSKNIAIFCHEDPDADALCSAFGLKNLIKNNFDLKNVDVFCGGQIGDLYSHITRDENVNPEPKDDYDIAFVLDCENPTRLGEYLQKAQSIPTIVNIDHHHTNPKFGHCNIVSSTVSSTCELVYLIAVAQGLELTNLIAKQLYQGIITDTNNLDSPRIKPKTLEVVSGLLKYKFNPQAIEGHYFPPKSPTKNLLTNFALRNMKLHKGGLATMTISQETLTDLNATFEDTLGIVDKGLNTGESPVCAIFIERAPQYHHCSLRSNGSIDVGPIAKQFGGGGSNTVAAFQKYGKIDELTEELVKAITPLLPDAPDANTIGENNYELSI